MDDNMLQQNNKDINNIKIELHGIKGDIKNILAAQKNIFEKNQRNQLIIMKLANSQVETNYHNNIAAWVLSATLMASISLAMIVIGDDMMVFFEKATSIITVFSVFCCGIYATHKLREHDPGSSIRLTTAFSCLAVCYAAYVIGDFGSSYPNIAAIGFNLATMLMVLCIVDIVVFIKKFATKNDIKKTSGE